MTKREERNMEEASTSTADARNIIHCRTCTNYTGDTNVPQYAPCGIDGTLRYFTDGTHCQSFRFKGE